MAETNVLTTPTREISFLAFLPLTLRQLLTPVLQAVKDVEEIRIVQNKPLILRTSTGERFVAASGLCGSLEQAVVIDGRDRLGALGCSDTLVRLRP